jgi:hypothetical protein
MKGRLSGCRSGAETTVPNQPNIIVTSTQKPASTNHGPAAYALNHVAAPKAINRSAHEPVIGQYEGCGTK